MSTALAEILEEFKAKPEPGSAEPEILTLTERNGFMPQRERFKKRLALEDTSGYKLIGKGDIAFNPYLLWAGAIAQNHEWDRAVISPLYPTFKVRGGFDTRFVIHLLLTEEMIKRYDSIAYGSVPRKRRTAVQDFLNLRIPTPPPRPEQRRIAAILDHADALRSKRRESLARLDDLNKAIFLRMFGDPIGNERGWPVASLEDVFEKIVAGRNLVGQSETTDGLKVLKVSAVTSLRYKESERKPLPHDYAPPSEHFVRTGDLLFSRANTSELVGATALVDVTDGKTVLPDKLWRLQLAKDFAATPNFMAALMQRPTFRTRVSDLATGSSGSMKNISKAKFYSIHVGMPPLEDRIQYNCLLATISGEVNKARAHIEHLDTLFASLQSRAFRGEL